MARCGQINIFVPVVLFAILRNSMAFAPVLTQLLHVRSAVCRFACYDDDSSSSSSVEFDRVPVAAADTPLTASSKTRPHTSITPSSTALRRQLSTRIQQSAMPAELPTFPAPRKQNDFTRLLSRKSRLVHVTTVKPLPTVDTSSRTTSQTLSQLDIVLFVAYFCNVFVLNLSVVTVPALASGHLDCPRALAGFEASMASLVPMGAAIGKLVNGFVCQRLGGQKSSWIYLLALSLLSFGMSVSQTLAPIGMILLGCEFVSSIQWTSMCSVFDQNYRISPEKLAKGISLLSLASYSGAFTAKVAGAALLRATNSWRTVTLVGTATALVGALSMYFGVPEHNVGNNQITETSSMQNLPLNPLHVIKTILGNKLFWMIGIANSLGYIARGSDRLLIPLLHEVSSLPRPVCACLTSTITVGFIFGIYQGTVFSNIKSVQDKMSMLRKNYIIASLSVLGIVAVSIFKNVISAPLAMAGAISLLIGIAASTVSFQYAQMPSLVSSTVFPENASVSLSLMDAAGYFLTAQVLAANKHILTVFGWSGSWTFLFLFFTFCGALMMKFIQPVLAKQQKLSYSAR